MLTLESDLTQADRLKLRLDEPTITSLINDEPLLFPDQHRWTHYVWDLRRHLPETGFEILQHWALNSTPMEDDDPALNEDEAIDLAAELWNGADRPFDPRRDAMLVDLARDMRDREIRERRIDRSLQRGRALHKAYADGAWRPDAGDEAVLFASLMSPLNAHWLDDWEQVLSYFEMKTLQAQTVAHFKQPTDFSGQAIRYRSAERRIRGRFH